MNDETTTHLLELMAGLEIPNPEFWLQQEPGKLRLVGESIADQAKNAESLEKSKDWLIGQIKAAQKASDEAGMFGMVASIAWNGQMRKMGRLMKEAEEAEDTAYWK